jgi:GNAT superfamily N-acetyltransferase
MAIRIRRCTEAEAKELHEKVFPDDLWDGRGAHWIAYDGPKPVGFCTARKLSRERSLFLSWCGILPGARKKNLQRRMIRVRLAYGRREGLKRALTYTRLDNYPSMCNLLKEGFRFYQPAYPWAGHAHYFQRPLQASTNPT